MRFLFPSSTRHIPEYDKIRLLDVITYNNKFPGFLKTESLNIYKENKANEDWLIYNEINTSTIAKNIKTKPYLFIPFKQIHTYIVDTYFSNVLGFISRMSLSVSWLENPVSTYEVWSSMHSDGAIVVRFAQLGTSIPCDLCRGNGVVDWVDEIQYKQYFPHNVPKDNYLLVKYLDNNYIINNRWINDYRGENIIYPCPVCYGLSCGGTLRKRTVLPERAQFEPHEEVEMVEFYRGTGLRRLMIKGKRKTFVKMPDYFEDEYEF